MSRRIVRSVTPCSSARSCAVVYRPASIRLRIRHWRMTSALRMRGVAFLFAFRVVGRVGFGAVEQVSLPELDAQRDQGLQLLLALDAFRDDARVDLVPQLAQREEQALLDAAVVDVAHEAGVELQEVGLDGG